MGLGLGLCRGLGLQLGLRLWQTEALEDALRLAGGGTRPGRSARAEEVAAHAGILRVELVDLVGIDGGQARIHIELVHLEVGAGTRLLALLVVESVIRHIQKLHILIPTGGRSRRGSWLVQAKESLGFGIHREDLGRHTLQGRLGGQRLSQGLGRSMSWT